MMTRSRVLAFTCLLLLTSLTPALAGQDTARLAQLLSQTGEKVIKEQNNGWSASYEGDFTTSIKVFITTSNGVIIITSIVDHATPPSHATLVALMRLSYDTDYAKLGLNSNQALIALTEADLATTDGPTLKKLIRGVAELTDRTVGLLVAAPTTLTFNEGRMTVNYGGTGWKPSGTPDYDLIDPRGEAWLRVIAERGEIPTARLTEIAIDNARKADPNLKVTARGTREVNGVRMSTLEIEAVVDQLPVIFQGYYYGGPEGAIQIIGWTSRNLAKEYRPQFERIADGFRIVR